MKLSQIVVHTWENYLLQLTTIYYAINAVVATDQEVFVIRIFGVLVVRVVLWRGSTVESFLFVFHHQETLSTGLLNILKEQEVCDKRE
jgi:hypothetical protein